MVGYVGGCGSPVAVTPVVAAGPRSGPREPCRRYLASAEVWDLGVHLHGIVLKACDRHDCCGAGCRALTALDLGVEPDLYASGYSVREAGPIPVSDAVHADVFDAGRIEPDVVVGAGFWRDATDVLVVCVVFYGPGVDVDGFAAAVLPDPLWHRMAVTVA